MSINLNNTVDVTGRLAADPRVFVNSDGSRKVVFTLFADHNYTNKATGERGSDRVPFEAFVSKDAAGLGVYDYMHQGDLVRVPARAVEESYPKGGATVYELKLKVDTENVQLLESKSVTQARAAKRAGAQVATAQAAPAQAPAVEQELPLV